MEMWTDTAIVCFEARSSLGARKFGIHLLPYKWRRRAPLENLVLIYQRPGRYGDRILVGYEIFPTCPDRPWGPPSLLYKGYRVSFTGLKRPERDGDHSPHLAPRLKREYIYTGVLISPQPDQEGNKLQRPNYKFCKPLKTNSEGCPSNQVSAAAMNTGSDEKWRHFNCFFSPVWLRIYQLPLLGLPGQFWGKI